MDAVGAGAVHGLPACQQVFEAFVAGATPSTGTQLADLQWFFETRRLVEAGQLGSLSVADINRFRDARVKFGAPTIASLYARWLLHGDAVFARAAAGASSIAVRAGQLVTEQVPGQYAHFGAFAGAIVLRRCRPLYWTTVSALNCASPPANSSGHSLRTNS